MKYSDKKVTKKSMIAALRSYVKDAHTLSDSKIGKAIDSNNYHTIRKVHDLVKK